MQVKYVVLRDGGVTVTFDDQHVEDLNFVGMLEDWIIHVSGLDRTYKQAMIDYFADEANFPELAEIFPWHRVNHSGGGAPLSST